MSIVSTNVPYNSTLLSIEIYELLKTYPFLNLQVVGTSVLGKPIYVIRLGKGKKHVFYSASIHAKVCIYQLHTFYLSKNNVLILLERYFLLY